MPFLFSGRKQEYEENHHTVWTAATDIFLGNTGTEVWEPYRESEEAYYCVTAGKYGSDGNRDTGGHRNT